MINKLKYLYRTNWIVRFTAHFILLYALMALMLFLVHLMFGVANNFVVIIALFLVSLGVTGVLRNKNG